MEMRSAVPVHTTPVVDQPWDANANVARLKPDQERTWVYAFAWYDSSAPDPDHDGLPERKSDYKLPHHEVDEQGRPGAANLNGVRNALARLEQSDIPQSDWVAVRRHLNHHLAAEHMQGGGMHGQGTPGTQGTQGNSAPSGHLIERNTPVTIVERRFTQVPVEVRTQADPNQRKIGGYAAMFNRLSGNLGGFVELVDPVFFNRSRGEGWPDVVARYNHDDNMLLGTTGANTLTLSLDDQGLRYEVNLPQSRGDVHELVQRGDIRKSSFAFRLLEDDWSLSEQNYPMRRLLDGVLVDVAPVNFPAYSDTSVGARGVNPDGALMSLATRMSASVDEVRAAAQANELQRFFVRSDRGYNGPVKKPTTFGPAALLLIQTKQESA